MFGRQKKSVVNRPYLLGLGLICFGSLALVGCGLSSGSAKIKIVGGIEDYETFPPAVGLALARPEGQGGYCTGTVVRDNLVLTAAHCLLDSGAVKAKLYARPGSIESDDIYTEGVALGDATRVVFPGYRANHASQTFNSDVAFIVFPDGSLSKFQKARIAVAKPRAGDIVTLVGIGQTDVLSKTSNPKHVRHSGTNTIDRIDDDRAAAVYIKTEKVEVDAAGGAPGDSGGPLVNRAGEQIGVAHAISWSDQKPITSNASISSEQPLYTTYVNLTDPGVTAFVAAVMAETHPTAQTGQSVTPTPMMPW